MADPLSATASVVAIVTVTVQSVKALHKAVSRYKGQDKILQRLQNALQEVISVMESFREVAYAGESIYALLQRPVNQCSEVCQEFKQSIESFNQNRKAGFLNEAKLEFKRCEINEFVDTISSYKSTIAVGLGAITVYSNVIVLKVH